MTRVETVLRFLLPADKQHILSPVETASLQEDDEDQV